MTEFEEREESLRRIFSKSYGEDTTGIGFWMKSLILQVQAQCAKRALYGDCENGLGCRDGYQLNSEEYRIRRKAHDDILALRWSHDDAFSRQDDDA